MNKNYLMRIFLILVAIALAGCLPAAQLPTSTPEPELTPTATAEPPADPEWWKSAVFYQIFVRSFYDSNGDGIGDFRGIIEKMDYLNDGNPLSGNDLEINAIWLMPIHPSPSYHGYDVTDYLQVNPDYGTLDDFKALIAEAHKRDVRVIIDFVINHTSTQHPWFQASKDVQSEYHPYYIWKDEDPGFSGPQGQKVWHRAPNGKYYYALFWDQMPDLNLQNPAVTEQIKQIAHYWLVDVGVDGFRVDGAKHLIEEGSDQENTDQTHAWFEEFFIYYKNINPYSVTVGEVWSNSFEVVRYVKNDGLDVVFNFDLARSILNGVNSHDAGSLANTLSFETRLFPPGSMGIFLSNHDQDRVMSVLMEDEGKARVAAAIYLTSPGIPFIYYGEEIGLTGQGDHRNIRTPMHWSSESKAGFTTGTPWIFHKADFKEKNVATQLRDPDSLLRHYQNLLRARAQSTALQQGALTMVDSGNRHVLAYLRVSADEAALVLLNLSDEPVEDYALSAPEGLTPGEFTLLPLIGELPGLNLTVSDDGGFENFLPLPQLQAYQIAVFELVQAP
ncbi:MAG: alpha-amylase family glycosyl hydrolase [Bellilinea sp.]|jgi:glycosidase